MTPATSKLLYPELTDHLWKALRELLRGFRQRPGYSERELRNALAQSLKKRGLAVATEVPVIHRHNGQRIGVGFIDIVIACRVVVEVKNVKKVTSEHMNQLHRYVEDSGLALGVLVNLGCPDADLNTPEGRKKVFHRYYYPKNDPYR
jgi:GxxExxY protein